MQSRVDAEMPSVRAGPGRRNRPAEQVVGDLLHSGVRSVRPAEMRPRERVARRHAKVLSPKDCRRVEDEVVLGTGEDCGGPVCRFNAARLRSSLGNDFQTGKLGRRAVMFPLPKTTQADGGDARPVIWNHPSGRAAASWRTCSGLNARAQIVSPATRPLKDMGAGPYSRRPMCKGRSLTNGPMPDRSCGPPLGWPST